MITDEHFEALRQVREASANLRLTCIAVGKSGAMLHLAFDRDISLRPSIEETALLGQLRTIP